MESSATSVANDYCFIGLCSSDCWESYCDCALRVTPVSSKLILLNTFVEIRHQGKSCKGISEAIVRWGRWFRTRTLDIHPLL